MLWKYSRNLLALIAALCNQPHNTLCMLNRQPSRDRAAEWLRVSVQPESVIRAVPYAHTAPPQPLSPGFGGDAAQSELMSQLSTLDRLQFETAQARCVSRTRPRPGDPLHTSFRTDP